MERPIVTVIIPAYNVEDYLEKAINSICSQTLTDWEMFLIDDGSTDGTGQLCDALAADDERINVIHQENQGAAAARNKGIEKANGKYLFFMDADDWTSHEMLYEMVCLAENYYFDAWAGVPVNNIGRDLASIGRAFPSISDFCADVPEEKCAQMVITGFFIETYYSDTEYYIQKQAVTPRVFAARSEFREKAHELFDRNLLYTPWNKLYLTSFIKENNITFPSVHWDDFPFNLEVIKNIERVTVSDKAFYHFIRKRADSESEKYNPELFAKREEENQWLLDLYAGWKCETQQILLENMKAAQPVIEDNSASSENNKKTSEAEEKKAQVDQTSEPENGEAAEEKESQSETESNETAGDDNNNTEDTVKTQTDLPENTSSGVPEVCIPSPAAGEFIARRYLERIVGCVENVTNPACTLTPKEKRKEIKEIITKDSVRDALKTARPRSLYMRAMLVPVRMKSTQLTYLEGKFISKIKKDNVKLFAKLKANR